MAYDHESFWTFRRYAVVGNSARKPFPRLTYGGLKRQRETVYAVDPSAKQIEGDPAYPDLASLPGGVDAAVLELPQDETAGWVEKAIAAGIKDIWLHQHSETPEAVSLARAAGVKLRTGTCAVMYLSHGFSQHTIHRFINKLFGKY